MVKAIMSSIQPTTDLSESSRPNTHASQMWTIIIHLRGSGLGVAVMMTRCTLRTQRIGESSDRGGGGGS
jgi:hypothetical protein